MGAEKVKLASCACVGVGVGVQGRFRCDLEPQYLLLVSTALFDRAPEPPVSRYGCGVCG